ncbi:family 2 glycosyl transferase [Pseudooceanicola sp.]|uniref:glycosyltransferase family 2 protein n=1 Tax=Pseudooceanicola sp. TaxID=1914328 RepID=UPI002602B12C|nr:family 2 glycosyl transferase [Pseudooceanicola sp.]MDF1856199.1 family 2 glycosyl transferase [Pseudooceanicola sp.]
MIHYRMNAQHTAVSPLILGIATTGRPGILRATLIHLAGLADRPDQVIVCIADPKDVSEDVLPAMPFSLRVILSERGTCVQRNTMLDAVPDAAVLLFIDDDFMPADGYFSACRQLFADHPDVVMATGQVLADGISGPGMDHVEGAAQLAAAPQLRPAPALSEVYNAYGCNMAVRVATAQAHQVSFDTDLPCYGWLEDVDFSRRIAPHGRIVKYNAMQGVHLGTKTGRSKGLPLGYSQIANPVYMIRKGSMSRPRALRMMLRNLLANLAHAWRPEPWVDRRGRLRGNLLALRDLISGQIAPNRSSGM